MEFFGVVTSGLELLGAASALAYLVLIANRSCNAWAFYIASSALYAIFFWRGSLYADSVLQVFFIGVGLYGWQTWSQLGSKKMLLSKMTLQNHMRSIVAVGILVVAIGTGLYCYSDAGLYAFPDAFILVGSVLATFLTIRGIIENWWYWAVINATTVFVYYSKEMYLTVGLASLYFLLSFYGLFQWLRGASVSGQDTEQN